MKLRHKETGIECSSNQFNVHAIAEIVVYYPEDCDSDFIRNYDVFIEATGEWKDLNQAFADKDVITDNYNTRFFEPRTVEDKERGFTLV